MTRLVCLVWASVLAMMGCRTSGTAVEAGSVGGIGDDVCALGLTFDLIATDAAGKGVSDVELWRMDNHHVGGKAFRVGTTDDSGRLSAPDCYMQSSEYRFWQPNEDPVRLHLMLVREGYGAKHLHLIPSTQEVLESGNMLGVPPGQSFEWSQIKPPHGWTSFHVVTSVTLDAVECSDRK